MKERTLYCIVSSVAEAHLAKPDMGYYSPKELAYKENVSLTSVYTWLNTGLPCMRAGERGNIRIYYQDFIQWMIESAKSLKPHVDTPAWAFRFVKSATPKVKVDPANPVQTSLF